MNAEYYMDALLDRMSLTDVLIALARCCDDQAFNLSAWEDDIGASAWRQAAETIAHIATFETIKGVGA
jgi:hypothetical protein